MQNASLGSETAWVAGDEEAALRGEGIFDGWVAASGEKRKRWRIRGMWVTR